jgi:hypothetical protein
MSDVTGFALFCSGADRVGIKQVMGWLRAEEWVLPTEVSDHATGGKAAPFALYIGGYNYFPENDFIDFFNSIEWEWPENVILILQDEHHAGRVIRPPHAVRGAQASNNELIGPELVPRIAMHTEEP